MKKFVFLFICLLYFSTGFAQNFNFTLTGNPINTTGWTYANGTSYPSNDIFVLTNPIGNQAGYIYYTTPENLTSCAQFTVTFDFQVTNSSSPTADGLAFWYISNPPNGFTAGGGLGLPNDPNGLLLLFDTYNNDGPPDNNPLISVRGYNGTQNYVEGSTTGLVGSELSYQSWVTDGNWHTASLNYDSGKINVYFDGSTTPSITGIYNLGQTGYFGFSASTGALYSQQSIRNVSITGELTTPPIVTPVINYCQFDNAGPLTASGPYIFWYDSDTSQTPLSGPPTPNTSVVDTTTWYVSESQTPDGCQSARDSITVIVAPKPQPPTVTGAQNYCGGQQFVPFNATGQNILWYTNGTGGTGDPNAPNINTMIPGVYTYYVSQTVNGCESNRTSVTDQVYDQVLANFTYDVHYGCHGDTVIFNNTSTQNYYKWDFGDGSVDTITNPTHIYPVQGSYTVRLRVSSSNCVDSQVQVIDLNHPVHASFTYSADSICQHDTINFSNTSVATNPAYYWDFNDGSNSSAINPAHIFDHAGTFNVMLVAQDFVPCYDTAYQTVIVDTTPYLNFNMGGNNICQGAAVHFNADYSAVGNTGSIWDFGDGTIIQTGQNVHDIQHAYDVPGAYNIKVTANYRFCPDTSAAGTLNVKAFPVVNLGPDTSMCPNDPPILISDALNTANPNATWLWNTGDTTASILATRYGIYSTTVTIDGCSNSDSIEIKNDCYVDIPNAFTPNNDGVNDYFFPRQLLTSGVTSFKMDIYNRWGQIIFETSNTDGRGWDGKYNGVDQPEGVYIYMIDVHIKDGETKHYQGNITILR